MTVATKKQKSLAADDVLAELGRRLDPGRPINGASAYRQAARTLASGGTLTPDQMDELAEFMTQQAIGVRHLQADVDAIRKADELQKKIAFSGTAESQKALDRAKQELEAHRAKVPDKLAIAGQTPRGGWATTQEAKAAMKKESKYNQIRGDWDQRDKQLQRQLALAAENHNGKWYHDRLRELTRQHQRVL